MKLFLVAFAVIAAVAADVSHLPSNEYLPPVQQQFVAPSNEYLPPVQQAAPVVVGEAAPAHELADDGYRYKTHRRVVYRRNRRDVSHLPSNEYLPPVQEAPVVESAPLEQYAVPEVAPAHELAADGYRYKTHRRVVYRRNRRDVSHLLSNEYLPPLQDAAPVAAPSNEYLPPVQQTVVEAAPAHELADDGYRYKTHRRVVFRRHRREAPSNEYLPPVQEAEVVPAVQVVGVEESVPAHELADDGYRYKTHRRVVFRRHRRGAPSNEYLPPVQEAVPAPVEQVFAVEEAAPAHELADDGYRYKTHRRVVVRRNRRDVSHLPSNEYLPPVQEAQVVESAPVEQYVAVPDAAPAHELANDGYRYKTHRRVVYRRNRRDVSHLLSNEYLPPLQDAAPVAAPSNEYLPPVQQDVAPAHELAADGYRYKTHRRVVYRRH